MTNITSVKIDNVSSREAGEKKAAKLKEITKGNYHNFEFIVCPVGGSFDVLVTTQYDFEEEDKEKALLEILVFILASQI